MRVNFYDCLTTHSFCWLFLGNCVGLLLATLLLWPNLNTLLGYYTYARWVTPHLNIQLYGWCSLPLLGLLFKLYRPNNTLAKLALSLWTFSLLFSCLAWLEGQSSGKLFMEWSGASRYLITATFIFLALVLLIALLQTPDKKKYVYIIKWGLWLLLSLIPFIMFWAANPAHYPPINPDSGGATGSSLLGSSLGAITIIWATPLILGLRPVKNWNRAWITLTIQAIHYTWFFLLDHGNRSHHEILQIISLASLTLWIPGLIWHLRGFTWETHTRKWLWAFCLWGAFLVFSAVIMFLPGILEHWKFTNALVGHTHAAMAGMLTSFNMIVLISLNKNTSIKKQLSAIRPFIFWQAGCLLHVLTLKILGTLESNNPGLLYRSDFSVDAFYFLRLIAGILMIIATTEWCFTCIKPTFHEKKTTS